MSAGASSPIDAAGRGPGPRLVAVVIGVDRFDHLPPLAGAARDARLVFDALSRTRLPATRIAARLVIGDGPARADGAAIRDALREAALAADARDTLLIYFAGHGLLVQGQVSLAPSDGDPRQPATLLTLADVQNAFANSPCPRRLLLLDACQEAVDAEQHGGGGSSPPPPAGRGWRARGRAAAPFADALSAAGRGWTILTSCGPGELSLESEELDRHGVFSYYVALGLRGEADLDGDGTVGLGELAQYVSNLVPVEAARASAGFLTQTPELICRGRIAPFTDPGAAAGDALVPERRRFDVPAGFLRSWARALLGWWPFEPLTARRWLIHGAGVIYGLTVAAQAALAFPAAEAAPWPAIVLAGLATYGLWLLAASLAIAAAYHRLHAGAYVAGMLLVVWHIVAAAAWTAWPLAERTPAVVARNAAAWFVILCLVIVFGCNALFTILSLADLERRREEGVLRAFFREMDQRWLRANLPNPLACETFHPAIYLIAWALVSVALVAHAGQALLGDAVGYRDAAAWARDLLLWLLVTWLTSGYHTAYRFIFRKHPRQVLA